jgi:hypothetical protein
VRTDGHHEKQCGQGQCVERFFHRGSPYRKNYNKDSIFMAPFSSIAQP